MRAHAVCAKPATATWSPLSLAGCELWLDASDASTFTYSSGTLVSQWDDKSGNGNHATQGTASKQPSRSVTIGGVDAVSFDGDDNDMTITNLALSQPYWLWLVWDYRTTENYTDALGTTGATSIMRPNQGGSFRLIYSGSVFQLASIATGVHCWGVYFAGTSTYDRLDGAASTTGDPGSPGVSAGTLKIAQDYTGTYLTMYAGEIVAVSGSMTSDEITAMESYFTDKWGTP